MGASPSFSVACSTSTHSSPPLASTKGSGQSSSPYGITFIVPFIVDISITTPLSACKNRMHHVMSSCHLDDHPANDLSIQAWQADDHDDQQNPTKETPGHTWDCPLMEWPTPLAAIVRLVEEEDATAPTSSAISWTEVGCRTAAGSKCLMRPQSRETATADDVFSCKKERCSPWLCSRSSKVLQSAFSSTHEAEAAAAAAAAGTGVVSNCSEWSSTPAPTPCSNAGASDRAWLWIVSNKAARVLTMMSLLLLLLLLQTSLPDELEWSPMMMDSSLGSSLKISTKLTLDDRATTTTTKTKLILITTQSSQAPAGKFSAIKSLHHNSQEPFLGWWWDCGVVLLVFLLYWNRVRGGSGYSTCFGIVSMRGWGVGGGGPPALHRTSLSLFFTGCPTASPINLCKLIIITTALLTYFN